MYYKRILIFVISVFASACHFSFKNPSDPEADNYIGYPVVSNVNAVAPVFPQKGSVVLFPSLVWSRLNAEAEYNLRIYDKNFPVEGFPVYSGTFYTNSIARRLTFSLDEGWPASYTSALDNLDAGEYLWHVKVRAESTYGEWGRASELFSFVQDVKMVSSGFEDKSRYSYNFYSGDGYAEKIDHYSGPVFLESEVKVYDISYSESLASKRTRREVGIYFFSDKSCNKDSFKSFSRISYQSHPESGLLLESLKERTTDFVNYTPVEKKVYSYYEMKYLAGIVTYSDYSGNLLPREERSYFYDLENQLEKIEFLEFYRNGSTGELRFKRKSFLDVENFNILKHEIYDFDDENPEELKLVYMYEIEYLESYPSLRKEAVFYFPIDGSSELEKRYIYEYYYNVKESRNYIEAKEDNSGVAEGFSSSVIDENFHNVLNFQIY
ncbi:MAG: hypothetical protein JXR63_13390 [Spirochaetales bacterium]|nr:hypothetical protein [Spirochaetales bacterium]